MQKTLKADDTGNGKSRRFTWMMPVDLYEPLAQVATNTGKPLSELLETCVRSATGLYKTDDIAAIKAAAKKAA